MAGSQRAQGCPVTVTIARFTLGTVTVNEARWQSAHRGSDLNSLTVIQTAMTPVKRHGRETARLSLCFRQHWRHCVGRYTLIRRGLGWQRLQGLHVCRPRCVCEWKGTEEQKMSVYDPQCDKMQPEVQGVCLTMQPWWWHKSWSCFFVQWQLTVGAKSNADKQCSTCTFSDWLALYNLKFVKLTSGSDIMSAYLVQNGD